MYKNLLTSQYLAVRHLKLTRLWLWIGLAMIFTIVALSVSNPPAPVKSLMVQDKLVHCLAYGVLMGWFAQIFRHRFTRLSLGIAFVLFGISVEYMQSIVPWRSFEVLDMVANTSGVVLAWALSYTWLGRILEWLETRVLYRTPAAPC